MEDAIKPLGVVVYTVKCSNPMCRVHFKIELNEETLCSCPACGKEYYVRREVDRVWIKSLGRGKKL